MEEMNFSARAHDRILLLICGIYSVEAHTFVNRVPDPSTGHAPACSNPEDPTITVPI